MRRTKTLSTINKAEKKIEIGDEEIKYVTNILEEGLEWLIYTENLKEHDNEIIKFVHDDACMSAFLDGYLSVHASEEETENPFEPNVHEHFFWEKGAKYASYLIYSIIKKEISDIKTRTTNKDDLYNYLFAVGIDEILITSVRGAAEAGNLDALTRALRLCMRAEKPPEKWMIDALVESEKNQNPVSTSGRHSNSGRRNQDQYAHAMRYLLVSACRELRNSHVEFLITENRCSRREAKEIVNRIFGKIETWEITYKFTSVVLGVIFNLPCTPETVKKSYSLVLNDIKKHRRESKFLAETTAALDLSLDLIGLGHSSEYPKLAERWRGLGVAVGFALKKHAGKQPSRSIP